MYLPPETRAVKSFLTAAVSAWRLRKSRPCRSNTEEFEGCQYLLSIEREQPDVVLLAFSAAYKLEDGALNSVWESYANVAAPLKNPPDGFQIALEVSISALCEMSDEERREQIDSLARIRLVSTGYQLRQLLCSMLAGKEHPDTLTVLSKPNAPFFARVTPESAMFLFPIWRRSSTNDLLSTAFVQEFADARRALGLGDAPQCSVTHPGQAPPFELDDHQKQLLGGFWGEHLTLTVQRSHLKSREQTEKMIWSLLTFYANLDFHVQSFKAFIHTKMRKNADNLLLAMESAQANPRRTRKLPFAATGLTSQ